MKSSKACLEVRSGSLFCLMADGRRISILDTSGEIVDNPWDDGGDMSWEVEKDAMADQNGDDEHEGEDQCLLPRGHHVCRNDAVIVEQDRPDDIKRCAETGRGLLEETTTRTLREGGSARGGRGGGRCRLRRGGRRRHVCCCCMRCRTQRRAGVEGGGTAGACVLPVFGSTDKIELVRLPIE